MNLPCVLLLAIIRVTVQGQTCTLGRPDMEIWEYNPIVGGLYIQSEGLAPCAGQLTQWTICYYGPPQYSTSRSSLHTFSLQVWRKISIHQLVLIGSHRATITLPSNVLHFQCVNISAHLYERINVQQGDLMGVLLDPGSVDVLPVINTNASSGQLIYIQSASTNTTSVVLSGLAPTRFHVRLNAALHVNATIGQLKEQQLFLNSGTTTEENSSITSDITEPKPIMTTSTTTKHVTTGGEILSVEVIISIILAVILAIMLVAITIVSLVTAINKYTSKKKEKLSSKIQISADEDALGFTSTADEDNMDMDNNISYRAADDIIRGFKLKVNSSYGFQDKQNDLPNMDSIETEHNISYRATEDIHRDNQTAEIHQTCYYKKHNHLNGSISADELETLDNISYNIADFEIQEPDVAIIKGTISQPIHSLPLHFEVNDDENRESYYYDDPQNWIDKTRLHQHIEPYAAVFTTENTTVITGLVQTSIDDGNGYNNIHSEAELFNEYY